MGSRPVASCRGDFLRGRAFLGTPRAPRPAPTVASELESTPADFPALAAGILGRQAGKFGGPRSSAGRGQRLPEPVSAFHNAAHGAETPLVPLQEVSTPDSESA